MRALALSTMYAQQERFADGAAFSRYAAEAGYDAIEVSHSTPAEKLSAIQRSGALPITAIHQPAPHVVVEDGGSNAELNLAATLAGERLAALEHALTSVEWAAKVGAHALVVHLGSVEPYWAEGEAELYRLYEAGAVGGPRAGEVRAEMESRRTAAAPAALAAARSSLETLVAAAREHGIAIGLENRLHFHEIPHPAETLALVDGFAPDEVGHWHDTGHAEVLERLGFMPHRAWFDSLGERLLGAHVHDVRGVLDHRAPGTAELDWAMVARGLGALDGYTLEINQHERDEAVRGVRAFLESAGLG